MLEKLTPKLRIQLILLAVFVSMWILSGFILPRLISSIQGNWEKRLSNRINEIKLSIHEYFSEQENELFKSQQEFLSILANKSDKKLTIDDYFEALEESKEFNATILVFDKSQKLIYWNNDNFLENSVHKLDLSTLPQTIVIENKLQTFLCNLSQFDFATDKYYLIVGKLVDDKSFNSSGKAVLDLSSNLSIQNNVSINIQFNNSDVPRDGRLFIVDINNSANQKIGIAVCDKPSINSELQLISENFYLAQSVLFILTLFILIWIGIGRVKSKEWLWLITVSTSLIAMRIVLFYFNIPSKYFNNSLTDSANFSSTFGFGIVRSPLELFITVVTGFIIITLINEKTKSINFSFKKRSPFSVILLFVLATFLILLFYRGIGASIRSVIFDSSLLYFKDFTIIPSAPIFLMSLNILLIGSAGIMAALLIVKVNYSILPNSISPKLKLLIMLVWFQIAGILFDYFQREPQGTPIIRVVFLLVIVAVFYFNQQSKLEGIRYYVLTLLCSSLITINLLTYYNSELERESLKTAAHEIKRVNKEFTLFMINQTLTFLGEDNDLKIMLIKKEYNSAAAYKYWLGSLLSKEMLVCSFKIYNSQKEVISQFATTKFNNMSVASNFEDSLTVAEYQNLFKPVTTLAGSIPLWNGSEICGYVFIEVLNPEQLFPSQVYEFVEKINPQLQQNKLEYSKYNLFELQKEEIVRSYARISLNEEIINILSTMELSNLNEGWLNYFYDGEKYLVYVLENEDGGRIITIKEYENISWNLSNFFKVFLTHAIIILLVLAGYILINFGKSNLFAFSFRTKITTVLIIVSILPLFGIAQYFRILSDDNRIDSTKEYLSTMSQKINDYYYDYYTDGMLNDTFIFEEIHNKFGYNYSVYSGDKLIYSSYNDLIDAGLQEKSLPYLVSKQLSSEAIKKHFVIENEEQIVLLSNLEANPIYILKLDNYNNKYKAQFGAGELDLFIFGMVSFMLLVLIIISTLLAKEISRPIQKLIKATKSVGSGDYSMQITNTYRGEIGELIYGFNSMVKKINEGQSEIALLEREAAWKEMAKQVAHEIKNPLTPIKLSIQQLIIAYRDKSPKFELIFDKVTTTVLTQIDILTNIASEFSAFARMPKQAIKKVDILNSINEIITLFADENVNITVNSNLETLLINADKDSISRLFINLVRNSIQAESKIIIINVDENEASYFIRIIDDGIGIRKEDINKVFDENYTTKNDGMGIGLSMVQKIIESINGNIVVEKSSESGTTFLITLSKNSNV
jgi:signal transduction histidine kinase/type II secretory pathway pseudopilin PulG